MPQEKITYQPRLMFQILKRIISVVQFFWAPKTNVKSDEIENLNFMYICLPPLPLTCQDSNFICITQSYIPSTAHFNARQQISYKRMKHQPIIP